MTRKVTVFVMTAIALCFSVSIMAQSHEGHASQGSDNFDMIFRILELPFLFLCVFFAFKTAIALKGGVFGKGMNLMAWGFLVMAVGHLHMQLEHLPDGNGINLFKWLLGDMMGQIAWFIALVVTWTLSGLGFYYIYKASKG